MFDFVGNKIGEGATGLILIADEEDNRPQMFHDMGYNVLVPDARGHGKSEGDYIGFGWPERKDYVQWINKVLENNGKSQEIVLYGVSMGAATVMMTSGEKLPDNVIIFKENAIALERYF
ncbi:hypothetical protein EfmJHP35_13930 [Enterococcus faecium]|nr:hypothetical protein EfmJHP35_13930 [Enterococcus faecium]